MALVNQVTISGYVVGEPKVFGKDRNVGKFRLRHDKSKRVGDKWETEAHWFGVTVFGGDNVEKMLDLEARDKVIISGRLQWSEYEPKDGPKRETVDIVASEFALVPTPEKATPPGPSPSREAQDFLDVS